MNIPYENQRFSLSNGIYSPKPDGAYKLVELWFPMRMGLMSHGTSFSVAHLFPDGTFTNASLKPLKAYYFLVDKYVFDPKGKIRITGLFPDFKTSDGIKVWMDHDGSFVLQPVDFKARLILRRKHMASMGRSFREVTTAKAAVAGLRHFVRPNEFGGAEGYTWTVKLEGKDIATGVAENEVMAENMAREYKRSLIDNITLTTRTKRFNPEQGFLTVERVDDKFRAVRTIFRKKRAENYPVDDLTFDKLADARKHVRKLKQNERFSEKA